MPDNNETRPEPVPEPAEKIPTFSKQLRESDEKSLFGTWHEEKDGS